MKDMGADNDGLDREDWIVGRCYRICRSGRTPSFLLSCPGSEGAGLLPDLSPFQGKISLTSSGRVSMH